MWEMRAPGLIDPYRVQMAWSAAGQDHMMVRDRVSLGNFLRAGGNALVVQSVARQWLPNVLQPVECASADLSMPSQPLEESRGPASLMHRARNCGCRCCAVTTSDAGSVVAVPPITSTSSCMSATSALTGWAA